MYRGMHVASTQSSCLSNLKQLDLGLLMYTADWDDLCPPQGDWEQRLNPYLKNNQLWICPTSPKEPGYTKNHKLAGVKMQDIRQPAQTLTFWDAGANVQGFPPPPGTTSPRHNGFDNFAFADGHANSAQPAYLQAFTDP
jgi:prepilin-type processing-associated H-X9-DG protein